MAADTRFHKSWNEQETQILTDMYPKHGAEKASGKLPGRSPHSVRWKASELGISHDYGVLEKSCIDCDVTLTEDNTWPSSIKNGWRICAQCSTNRARKKREKNPEKTREWQRKYKKNHRERIRMQRFLNGNKPYHHNGYFRGQGSCLICGELDPLILVNDQWLRESDFLASLCAGHHRKYKSNNSRLHMIWILKAIENGFMFKHKGEMKILWN